MQYVTTSLYRRMVGFYALPLLSILASLGTLPAIARNVDARTWVAIAVGQAIGTVASIAATIGWNFNGPIQLPGKSPTEKASLLGASLVSRVAVTLTVAPLAAFASVAASPPGTGFEATAFAVSGTLVALSPLWFCVGEGRPGWSVQYDAGPRFAASLVGTLCVIYGTPVIVLPVMWGFASVLTCALFAYKVQTQFGSIRAQQSLLSVLRVQMPGTLTSLVAGSYSTAAVVLVSVSTTTAESSAFASGARLYALGLFGITVATQAVLADTRRGRQTRDHLHATLVIYSATGILGLVGLGALAGWASRLLLTKTFEVDQPDAVFFGLSYMFVALGTWLSQVILVPLGDRAWNLASVVVGAIVGVPCIMGLSALMGSSGGSIGLFISEFAVAMTLSLGSYLLLRGSSDVRSSETNAQHGTTSGAENGP